MMSSSSSLIKPRPTSDVLQSLQTKQSLCQWRSSNEMKRVPPIPTIKKHFNLTRCWDNNLNSNELTGNWFGARRTTFSEELTEAIGTVRLLIATRESLSSELNRAVSACETFTMVWFVLVGDATTGNYLKSLKIKILLMLRIYRLKFFPTHISALDTTCSKFIFITSSTIDILLARNERLRSNRCLTNTTAETFLMPLACFIFHLLRA